MLSKRQQWIPYTSLNPTVRLSLLRAWNVWVNGDPSAREDRNKTTPYNIPYSPTMREVGATIWAQREVVSGRDGAGINKGSLNQVVEKE